MSSTYEENEASHLIDGNVDSYALVTKTNLLEASSTEWFKVEV